MHINISIKDAFGNIKMIQSLKKIVVSIRIFYKRSYGAMKKRKLLTTLKENPQNALSSYATTFFSVSSNEHSIN